MKTISSVANALLVTLYSALLLNIGNPATLSSFQWGVGIIAIVVAELQKHQEKDDR